MIKWVTSPLTTIDFSSEAVVLDDVDPEEFGVDERSLSKTLEEYPVEEKFFPVG